MNIKNLILKEFINLFENKDHLIKKLDMTDEQKQEVMDYFKKFPHREKEIDWNRKDLQYTDFANIMKKVSKTQKKKKVHLGGIEGLETGEDYLNLGVYDGYNAYVPMTYEASKLIASKDVGDVEGKWCTAYQKNDDYWYSYTDDGVVLIYFVKNGDKIALAYSLELYSAGKEHYEVFDKNDKKYTDANMSKLSIDIDGFISENKERLIKALKNILSSDQEYREKRKEFIYAIDNENWNKVIELIEWGVNPSAKDNYAIRWASLYNHFEVVKLLLQDKRVDPSAEDNQAIRYTSEKGHLKVIKLLLQDKRVDPSVDDNYAIQWASLNGHLEVVKLLLQDSRVDPLANDNIAIRWASDDGHTEIVKLLLQDKRVRNSLSKEDIEKYEKKVGINESIDENLNKILLTEKQSKMTISKIIKQMENNFRDTKQYIQLIKVYDFKVKYQKMGGLLTFIAKTQSPNRNEYKLLIQFRGIKEYPFASDKTFDYKDSVTGKIRYIEKPDPQKHFVKVKSTSPDFIWRGQLACYHKGCLYGKVTKQFTTYKKKTNRPPYKTNSLKIPILGKHLWGFVRTLMNDGYILKKWGK